MYLKIGTLTSPQPAHPEIGENDLAAGVGKECPVIRGNGEGKARLTGPVLQLGR